MIKNQAQELQTICVHKYFMMQEDGELNGNHRYSMIENFSLFSLLIIVLYYGKTSFYRIISTSLSATIFCESSIC